MTEHQTHLRRGLLPYLLAIVLLAFRRIDLPATIRQQGWIARLHDPKAGMPYGIALAAAALWVWPTTKLFSSLMS